MSDVLSREETALLALARAALTGAAAEGVSADTDWEGLCALAERHAVLPLLCPVLQGLAPERLWKLAAEKCTAQFYRLAVMSRYYTALLAGAGVKTVVLKGAGAARYYPVPEHRKSGDIDLLLADPGQMEQACRVLESDGAAALSEQHANHHRAFRSPEGIELEVHSTLTEDFDDGCVNALCASLRDELGRSAEVREVLPGLALPVPDAAGQAVSLLLHMLQHFLRAGFGLKLLCDWAAFWNALPPGTDMARYERFVDEAGVRGFADMAGGVCVRYLGLRPEQLTLTRSFDADTVCAFLREVFDAEEFGRSSSRRMVMVRRGLAGYVREFHHQMRLNYPRAGRCPLLWPALWCATLWRFLRNNRTVRGTTTGAVLKEARRRSRLMEPLALFQNQKDTRESR